MKVTSRGLLLFCLWLLPLGFGILIGRQYQPAYDSADPSEINDPRSSPGNSSSGSNTTDRNPSNRDVSRRRSVTTAEDRDRIEDARYQLAEILNTSDRIDRMRQMIQFIDHLSPDDIEDVISGFRDSGWVEFNRTEYSLLISAWMSQDPHTALAYFSENDPDGWTRKTAIAAWASESPEAAASAIAGLEDEGEVNDWIVGLAQGMARNDPTGALLTLQELPGDQTRAQAIQTILPEVVTRGTEFAGEWIAMINDPKLQRETATRLARPLADRDPVAAAEWVRDLDTVSTRRDASEVVADVFASNDLQGAKIWAESLPHDTMTEAAEGVAKHLARENPAEASRWLQNLGNDPDLDGARFLFLREAGKQDPQIALDSVPTLSKPADQERYYREILRSWSKTDKEAAISWTIAHSETLPPKVVKSMVPKETKSK